MKQKKKPEVNFNHNGHRLADFAKLPQNYSANMESLEREYTSRLNKVQHSLYLFCKKHDPHGLLERSQIIRQLEDMEAKKDLAPFVPPAVFESNLKEVIRYKPEEILQGGIPLPSTDTGYEAVKILNERNTPKFPLVRLTLFGHRQEVAKLAEISIRLGIEYDIDATQAAALQLFCFKQTPEFELKLVHLILMSNQTDDALGKAAWIYHDAIKRNEAPYFTKSNIEHADRPGTIAAKANN